MKTNVVILGSTGSIGRQALEVIDRNQDQFQVIALAAKNETDILARQIDEYQPRIVALSDPGAAKKLGRLIDGKIPILSGKDSLDELAALELADIVLIAVTGIAGISPTLAALNEGKRVALANKETLVAAGRLVMDTAYRLNNVILPVDSEHSAIFQCQEEQNAMKKIILTASGGPFRDYSKKDLQGVDVSMALKHPNWDMGPKISIDSATLMNKGLEVIEAHYLFSLPYTAIDVVVHRESIIHSMVQFADNSYKAHLGASDMRIPIQYAFTYPRRSPSPAPEMDFSRPLSFTFHPPDLDRFPALGLAYAAGRCGGSMPAVMNAANEVAVGRFMSGDLSFLGITAVVERVMLAHEAVRDPDLDTIMQADAWARHRAEEVVRQEGSR